MRNRTFITHLFKQILAVILLTSVFGGAFSSVVAAQTRRSAETKKTSAGKTSSTAGAQKNKADNTREEKIDVSGLIPPGKAEIMSRAFKNGALPGAAAAPVGNLDEQAAALAEAIAARDENSTAALMTALKIAGYGIRNQSGDVSYNQNGWQGIAFDEWEVAAMAKLYGDRFGVGLGKFADSLELITPAWKKENNAAHIVAAIRAASASENQSVRFWANLIIELGRYADAPFDLRDDESVKGARLDAVQIQLILSRLAADVNILARRVQQRAERDINPEPNDFDRDRNAVEFVRASFDRNSTAKNKLQKAGWQFANSADDPPLPCSLSEKESVILDYNATATTGIFGQFTQYLESKNQINNVPGAFLGATNAILIMLKLVASYAALDTEVTLDGGMLTRTKTTMEGERKALTARVKIDTGKWQTMNCIRAALNLGGIDFSLPTSGALANTRVQWELTEGGGADSYAERVLSTIGNIPAMITGETIESDAIVFLDTPANVAPGDKKLPMNFTDGNGESKIFAVGAAQKRDMSKDNLRAVVKKMAVKLHIQVKSMDLNNNLTAAGTGGDMAGNIIAFWTGDMVGGVVGTGAETIYRSTAGTSKEFAFPVKDWIPCDGGWHGTITYRYIYNKTSKFKDTELKIYKDQTNQGFEQDSREYVARVYFSPAPAGGGYKAMFQAAYRENYSFYNYDQHVDSCGAKKPAEKKIKEYFKTKNVFATGSGEAPDFSLDYDPFSGKINFGFMVAPLKGKVVMNNRMMPRGFCNQKYNVPQISNETADYEVDRKGYSWGARLDPQSPNAARGTVTIPGSANEKLVVSWDMSRCK